MLYYRVDAVLLSLFANTAVVGWYGAGYRLFDTLTFLPNIVITAIMFPVFAKYSVRSEAHLKQAVEKTVNLLLVTGLPVAIGLIVAAPNIIGFLYNRAEFAPAIPVLQLLAPSLACMYLTSIGGALLASTHRERRLPIMAATALIFNLLLNLILIPRWQHVGAALVTSLTELLLLCLAVVLLPRELIPLGSLRVAGKVLAASGVMALAVLPLREHSILVIVPVALLTHLTAATVLRAVPREDLSALHSAVRRKVRRDGVDGPDTDRPDNPKPVDKGPDRMLVLPARLRTVMSPGGEPTSTPLAGAMPAADRMARTGVALVRFATNHLVSHVPSRLFRHHWYGGVLGWDIGPNASIYSGQRVEMLRVRGDGKRVCIGAGASIGPGCLLSTAGGLLIGEHVRIGSGVWLVNGSQDGPETIGVVAQEIHRPIVIDDHAVICTRATVLGGVTIGKGAVVRAGAVVARDVAPYTVVDGVPARRVRAARLRNNVSHIETYISPQA